MAANASSASSTRPVTPTPSDTSSTDGPVLSVINKRLRALRKKHNRIVQMEDSVAQGKVLNKEQEETLRSKPVVLAQIEELEKLKQPLAAAVAEEHSVAVKKSIESEKEKEARASVEDEYVAVEEVRDRRKEEDRDESVVGVVGDVLNLLYFGSIFDVKSQSEVTSLMLTRTHERGCCLTYDRVTDDAADVLVEEDLDFISRVGGFLTSRPTDSSLSHKEALERCVEHAKLWLGKSEQPIGPDTNITYAGLRERLNKIMASEYFTTTPEMKAPVDVAVAAAAAGNYRSYEMPAEESGVAGIGESSVAQYEHQDEVEHYQVQEGGENEFSHSEEALKEQVAGGHNDISYQEEQEYTQKEMDQNQGESQQYTQRRGNQYPRGGRGRGRSRGYFNGRGYRGGSRGGGPYQNGRSHYYDQPGNNYPNNNYKNRGRGGRGSGRHGYSEYADAGRPSGDTGVAY